MKQVLIVLILALLSSNVVAALKESSFEKYGFEKDTFFDPEQNKVTIISDSKTGWKIKLIYPFLKNLVSYQRNRVVEIYNEKDELFEKTETDVLTFSKETRWPKPEKFEIRWMKTGQYLKTDYRWDTKLSTWSFAGSSIVSESIFESSCASPISFEELERLLASTEPIVKVGGVLDSEYNRYFDGTNIRTNGCERYGTEGVKELAEDIEAAFDQGLRCLANLGDWKPTDQTAEWRLKRQSRKPELINELRAVAAQLVGLLDPKSEPFAIYCDKLNLMKSDTDRGIFSEFSNDINGRTFICGKDILGPGMALHLFKFNQMSRSQRRSILFHELVHNTGILHHSFSDPERGRKFDAVYGAESCCIRPEDRDSQEFKLGDYSCARLITVQHGEID